MSSDFQYKIKRPEREYPVPDVEHLREWARRGNVGPNDIIYVTSLQAYYRAIQLQELKDIFASQPVAEPQYRSIHAPFYINQAGKQSPVERLEDLQEMAAAGRLTPDDSVYHPSFGRWRRARDVAQLAPYFAPRSGAHSITLPQQGAPRSSIDQINANLQSMDFNRPPGAHTNGAAPARISDYARPIEASLGDGAVESADSTARTVMDFQAADVARALRRLQESGQKPSGMDEVPRASIDRLNDLMLNKLRDVSGSPIRTHQGPDLTMKTPPPTGTAAGAKLMAAPKLGGQGAPAGAAALRQGKPLPTVRRPTAEFLQAGLVKPPMSALGLTNRVSSNGPSRPSVVSSRPQNPAVPSSPAFNPGLPPLSNAKKSPSNGPVMVEAPQEASADALETRLDMNAMPMLMGEMVAAKARNQEHVPGDSSINWAAVETSSKRPSLQERIAAAIPSQAPAPQPKSTPPLVELSEVQVEADEPLDEDAHFTDTNGIFRLFYDIARTFMVTKELRPGEQLETECRLQSTGDSFKGVDKRVIYKTIAQRIDEHLNGPLFAAPVSPENQAGFRLLVHRTRELLDIIRKADEVIGLMPPERVVIGNVGRPKMHPDEEKAMLRIDAALRGLIAVRAR